MVSPEEQLAMYLRYLQVKIQERDWHAVADAAMDLRELEAAHPELKAK